MHHDCAKTSRYADRRSVAHGRKGPAAGNPFCAVCLQKEGLLIETSRLRIPGSQVMVPLAGIEPALLAELDFESSASTSSATGAFAHLAAEIKPLDREAGGL